jgi:hypothetical protein
MQESRPSLDELRQGSSPIADRQHGTKRLCLAVRRDSEASQVAEK